MSNGSALVIVVFTLLLGAGLYHTLANLPIGLAAAAQEAAGAASD